jgi:hypothetical protein
VWIVAWAEINNRTVQSKLCIASNAAILYIHRYLSKLTAKKYHNVNELIANIVASFEIVYLSSSCHLPIDVCQRRF